MLPRATFLGRGPHLRLGQARAGTHVRHGRSQETGRRAERDAHQDTRHGDAFARVAAGHVEVQPAFGQDHGRVASGKVQGKGRFTNRRGGV